MKHGKQWLMGTAVGVTVAVAGCGAAAGGSGYGGGATSTARPAKAAGGAPLDVVNNPKLGKIIVDAKGRTLYDFVIDKGSTSVCYGACASLWPPYLTKGTPTAGKGATASLIGTTKRKDGTTEVTYGGHPLYYYAPDRMRGQISGQALDQFGAPWYALTPAGHEIH